MTGAGAGGRFSSANRHILDEDEIELLSVGVDIGSSTSHLVFSRVTMESMGSRYVVTRRETVHQSPIRLTPYAAGETIDAEKLGAFIEDSYRAAGIARDAVDTGALILTGVAVGRANARAIAELFAGEAGRFVAVSAGDGLEATMAAHGSGAVARSGRQDGAVLNIDIGGGTTKIARCRAGRVEQVTALDAGARLVVLDAQGALVRIEETVRAHARDIGLDLAVGETPAADALARLADRMAERIVEAAGLAPLSEGTRALLRLPPLAADTGGIGALTVSGGVSEYVYGREPETFGDLGPELARRVRARIEDAGAAIEAPAATIRATVVGASQYTVQLSGTTIFIEPADAVPLRNVPVIVPDIDLAADPLDGDALQRAIGDALVRLDLGAGGTPVAFGFRWRGSASFRRLHDFCTAVCEALGGVLSGGHPLILVNDGDIGGLVGLHLTDEMGLDVPVISIDGIELAEFDYIDIGEMIPSSGAVPVVIKSLVGPAAAGD